MTAIDTAEPLKVSRRRNIELVSSAVHRHSPFFTRRHQRAGFHARLFEPRLSPDLGGPRGRHGGDGAGARPPRRHDRLGRLQSAFLPHRCAREIIAVDLNSAHVALNRLKIAAAKHLDYADFRCLFAHAAAKENTKVFDEKIAPHLDAESKAYWDGPRLARTPAHRELYPRLLPSRTARPLHCRGTPGGAHTGRQSQGDARRAIDARPA